MARIEGTDRDDVLVGTPGADLIDAGAGNDWVRGLGGPDTLAAWTGNDTLDGGENFDELDLTNWTAPVLVSLALGRATLGPWTSQLIGIEAVRAGQGNDTMIGNEQANRLAGGGGNEAISAGAGDDVLVGDAGDDTLDGGPGIDSVFYGEMFAGVPRSMHVNLASAQRAKRRKTSRRCTARRLFR